MRLTTTQIVLLGIVLIIVVAAILLFTGVIPGLRQTTSKVEATLTVWGVFDNAAAINDSLIADFKKAFPNVNIVYRRVDSRTYEADLVNALAAGTGPDVFYVKNTWLIKHFDKLSPIPPETFPASEMARLFPDVVVNDFVLNSQVYAFPLYLDSLALLYNKTLFDQAGIASPPKTWDDVAKAISKLTRFDQVGRITRAGAAIGGSSRNINEATDLLSLIMLQSGVEMVSPNVSEATFSRGGTAALDYYVSFTRPSSRLYTWDPLFHYSIDAFAEESVAMIFNYAYQIPNIKEKNPFLNFAVAAMPQPADAPKTINYANYWALGVSNKTARPDLAWAFVVAATLDEATNLHYLNSAQRPPALRSLIDATINDPTVGVFSRQALTATDWPQVDAAAIDQSFTKMIDLVTSGQLSSNRALLQAEEEITQLLRQRFNP